MLGSTFPSPSRRGVASQSVLVANSSNQIFDFSQNIISFSNLKILSKFDTKCKCRNLF